MNDFDQDSYELIRIWAPEDSNSDLGDSVWLSSGTCLADSEEYETSARIPRHPWRKPSVSELGGLYATAFDEQSAVGIIRFPESLLRDIRAAYDTPARGRSQADHLATEGILRAMSDRHGTAHSVSINGLAEHLSGGAETVTRDRLRNNVRIGLHVDSWSGLPIGKRREARVRLCLNVGRRERYFLFLQRPVSSLAGLKTDNANCRTDTMISLHTNDIVRRYMSEFPDQPVLRVRVQPGEAYVAPTDNLIHDGSTAGNPQPDRNFNLFGHFHLIA